MNVMQAILAAKGAAFTPARASGCGRAYVCISSCADRKTVNAVAKACKAIGLLFLRRAYGTSGNAIYIGYDNCDGRAIGRSEVFAGVLREHGIACYSDAVGD